MSVDVAFAVVAPNRVLVNGKAEPVPPEGHAVLQSVDIHIVFADIAVVEAYGKVDAVEEVAVKLPARALLPRSELPFTERVRQGEVVENPTFPSVAFASAVIIGTPLLFLTLNIPGCELVKVWSPNAPYTDVVPYPEAPPCVSIWKTAFAFAESFEIKNLFTPALVGDN